MTNEGIVNAPVTRDDLEKAVPGKGKLIREIKLILRVYDNNSLEVKVEGVTSTFEIIGAADIIKRIVESNLSPQRQ
ncbi:NEQ322 [Nanoarchaeum equitans Kin4-M]|uniref:NEQ322 n=1 Tax=Nanoarchaeum equitans (strain Kin4-M) TaxID=228908 RepID=Q74MA0_NANEQ|nr:NEQ322 [Nanoarchaeum equitans Kin4-M]